MIGYLDMFREAWKTLPSGKKIVDLLDTPQEINACECVFIHLTDLRWLQLFIDRDPNCLSEVPSSRRATFKANSIVLWNGLLAYAGRIIVYRGASWGDAEREELHLLGEIFKSKPELAQEPLSRHTQSSTLTEWLERHLIDRPSLEAGFEAVVRLALDLELLRLYQAKQLSIGKEAQLELPGLALLKPLPDLASIWKRLRERSRALDISAQTLKPDLQFIGKFLENTGIDLVIPMEYEQEWIKRLSPATGKNAERS